MNRDEAPCLNCTDRHYNCHSECEHYKRFKQIIEDKKQKIKTQKEKEEAIVGVAVAGIKRMRRKK